MKAKVTRGGGFRGALNYVFDVGRDATGDKRVELIGGTVSGNNPRDLAREFAVTRTLRPDITRPVWHCSLALPKRERLTPDKWNQIASDFIKYMDFPDDTVWVAARHGDTDHDHIHIIASRVSLDGGVWLGQWEARRAIEATQQLEREHGLVLTPGLGEARKEVRSLSSGEINMAINTGDEPPRLKLQRLIDAAAEGNPSAPEFADRLAAAGVSVRANIAKTGTLSGFSFELDGIAFKGSQLGKAYAWAGLQKRGVTYEQTTDREGIERFKPAVADDRASEGAAGIGAPAAAELGQLAGGSSATSERELAESGQGERPSAAGAAIVRLGEPGAAGDAGAHDGADDGERSRVIPGPGGAPGADSPEPVPSDREADAGRARDGRDIDGSAGTAEAPAGSTAEHERSGGAVAGGGSIEPQPLVDADPTDGAGRAAGGLGGAGWNARFKQASAARRRAGEAGGMGAGGVEQGDRAGARVAAADRQQARELDPTEYLESRGYQVVKDGVRHRSVRAHGDEVYRLTKKPDGRWLWCDRLGNDGGDNIDLVAELEPGLGYAESVFRLLGAPTVRHQPRPPEPLRTPPVVPPETADGKRQGREYLEGRGISIETIQHAEKTGFLRHVRDAVLFLGRDVSGAIQNVIRRATKSSDPVQKRDFRGSDKRHPPILPGDPSNVWLVEGCPDALALHDLTARAGVERPTAIVTGGINVLALFQSERIYAILRSAQSVTLARDREKDADTQAKANIAAEKQSAAIEAITGFAPRPWWPKPGQGKDLADVNQWQSAQAEQQRQSETAEAQRIERDRINAELAREQQRHAAPRQTTTRRGPKL